MYERTTELRYRLDRLGMEYTKGYVVANDMRINEDNVTTVWPVRDEFCGSLTFEEDDNGRLCTDDAITPAMAVSMAVAASLEHDGRKI